MRYLLLSVLVFLVGILMVPNAFADGGDFYLTYIPTSDYPTHEAWLKDNKIFETHIEKLNNFFQLPHDIEIIIGDKSFHPDCKDSNAFYGDSKILICYELIEDIKDRFGQYYEKKNGYDWTTQEQLLALDDSVENVIENTLYHELGHAFKDVYNLRTTGLQEDVADQFAAYYILEFHDYDDPANYIGKKVMQDAAWDYWLISEEYPDLSPSAFADSHSLNEQRFYNFACWTYGAYPNDSQWMLDREWVLEDRAEYECEDDYQDMVQFWDCQSIFQEGVIPALVLSSCPAPSGGFDPSGIIFLVIVSVIIGVVIVVIKSRKKTAPLVQLPKITCRNCNHLNRSTAKVCAKCGNSVYHIYTRIMPPVKGKDEPKVTCRNCNHLNRSTSKFCVKCGTHVW
jgi:hypothetical protein